MSVLQWRSSPEPALFVPSAGRQLGKTAGKALGGTSGTSRDNAEFADAFGEWCVSWCRQGHSLNPPPRDGVAVCAGLQDPSADGGSPGSPCTQLSSGPSGSSVPAVLSLAALHPEPVTGGPAWLRTAQVVTPVCNAWRCSAPCRQNTGDWCSHIDFPTCMSISEDRGFLLGSGVRSALKCC